MLEEESTFCLNTIIKYKKGYKQAHTGCTFSVICMYVHKITNVIPFLSFYVFMLLKWINSAAQPSLLCCQPYMVFHLFISCEDITRRQTDKQAVCGWAEKLLMEAQGQTAVTVTTLWKALAVHKDCIKTNKKCFLSSIRAFT